MRFVLHACLFTMCISDALRGHKTVSDPQELELQIIVSHHVGAGIEPWYSGRADSALNC